jgi:hypothetical protein
MQLSFSMPFPEPLLAAMPQLSEKLRLGVQSRNPAWYPGFNVCNSTTAIGLQFRCSETVSGPVVAPNNNTPQQPQKKHCSANQRIGGAVKALEAAGDVSIALNLAYIHVAAAGALVGFGCLEPTPFEPVTCAASGFGGAALLGGGVVMSKMAVLEVEEGVIPGVKEMFCTE